jgi:hypothetical protein
LRFQLPRKSRGSLTCRKFATWDRRLYFPCEGRHAEDFFARKIRRLRPGSNPRSWVPEVSMLTTRLPKLLSAGLDIYGKEKTYCMYRRSNPGPSSLLQVAVPATQTNYCSLQRSAGRSCIRKHHELQLKCLCTDTSALRYGTNSKYRMMLVACLPSLTIHIPCLYFVFREWFNP